MHRLNARSDTILTTIITLYLQTHEPVGSYTLSQQLDLSPATIRNVMSDLEETGYLSAPHRSAGRVPTPKSLKHYTQGIVDQQLTHSPLSGEENRTITTLLSEEGIQQISQTIADLCQCAGVIFTAPEDPVLKSLDFLFLSPGKAMSILVTACHQSERRIIDIPLGIDGDKLQEASNYLTDHIKSRRLSQAIQVMVSLTKTHTHNIHALCLYLMQRGLYEEVGVLDVKGHSHLLKCVQHLEELRTFQLLFSMLEKQSDFSNLFMQVIHKRTTQIFFGQEEGIFDITGCSLIAAPYRTATVAGVVAVIGPLHMDYCRIIPIINTIAKLVERTT